MGEQFFRDSEQTSPMAHRLGLYLRERFEWAVIGLVLVSWLPLSTAIIFGVEGGSAEIIGLFGVTLLPGISLATGFGSLMLRRIASTVDNERKILRAFGYACIPLAVGFHLVLSSLVASEGTGWTSWALGFLPLTSVVPAVLWFRWRTGRTNSGAAGLEAAIGGAMLFCLILSAGWLTQPAKVPASLGTFEFAMITMAVTGAIYVAPSTLLNLLALAPWIIGQPPDPEHRQAPTERGTGDVRSRDRVAFELV